MNEKPHSADYFGDTRDFWWNRDFLELMSCRWKLHAVRRALDVGCGVGHWGRCLAPFLPTGASITGIDREAQWIEEARKKSAGISSGLTFTFLKGEAERLPFADGSFDLVTCQTVLIHVKNPRAVISEMARVLMPGGILVIVEPNNLASSFGKFELERPIDEFIALLEFQLVCERGKERLGEGFNSCGPYVAGWISEIGLEDVAAHLSDKSIMLMPPYSSPHARAMVREMGEMGQRDFWIWNRENALRYFLAGGGIQGDFESRWRMAVDRDRDLVSAISKNEAKVLYTPISILTSGRKAPNKAPEPTTTAVTPRAP